MKYLITDRKNFPASIRHIDQVKGFSVGGCFIGRKLDPCMAHAHISNAVDHHDEIGFICVRQKEALDCKYLMLHEAAHVIVDDWHSIAWAETVLNIGGTLSNFDYGIPDLDYRSRGVWGGKQSTISKDIPLQCSFAKNISLRIRDKGWWKNLLSGDL